MAKIPVSLSFSFWNTGKWWEVTIMSQGASNKCGSFENDIQLQLGSCSYLTTWPGIKIAKKVDCQKFWIQEQLEQLIWLEMTLFSKKTSHNIERHW